MDVTFNIFMILLIIIIINIFKYYAFTLPIDHHKFMRILSIYLINLLCYYNFFSNLKIFFIPSNYIVSKSLITS